MASATETVSTRVLGGLQAGGGGATFDINVILQILTTIMTLLKGCGLTKGKDAKKRCQDCADHRGLGWRLDTVRLRIAVRKHAPIEQQEEYEAAVLDQVGPTTAHEFDGMLAEAP